MTETALVTSVRDALIACGVDPETLQGENPTRTPLTGEALVELPKHTRADVEEAITKSDAAFKVWRDVPAPVRGQVVKRWAELLTEHKEDLAVGQSRMLFGKTMPSERPGHALRETWHPMGVVGIITAFNFPVAPYAWNTALALVTGCTVIWKPAGIVQLSAVATQALLEQALTESDQPAEVAQLVLADRVAGEPLVEDSRVALVSATGSVRMGREIAPTIAARFGRALLELGGNNAAIVTPSADLDLALRGITFAAAGTAGQRCTTMRRLIVHESIADQLVEKLVQAYGTLSIGDPRIESNLVGPLIHEAAYNDMQQALKDAVAQGGEVLVGGKRVLEDEFPNAFYVEPSIVKMPAQSEVMQDETFAPILYVLTYSDLDEAIALQNGVPQGLSSAIFTQDQAEAEIFLSSRGSDCGIANVNIGTSGAEIGGAFGGEKETGGGRESGSDAWQTYMRRATNTVNYSGELPLAQGVKFL